MYQYSELEFLSRIPLPRNSLAYRLLRVRHPQLSPEVPASPSERESIWRKVLVERCNDYRLVHSNENEYKAAKSMPDQLRLTKINRPFGVNLIGHAFEVFGIGEDVRMAARALKAANIPFCVVHHPADNGAPCTDRSLDPWLCKDPDGGPYAFNLICLTAPIQARWILQTGLDANTQPYTIASWPWETRKWPDSWLPLFEIVDEVWPSSTFTAEALQDHANHLKIPVKIMSMAVEITEPDKYCSKSSCSTTRQRLGISEQVVLFGYCFDIKSTATRKNPMATLEAFQQAFPLPYLSACKGRESTSHPLSQDVALLIKTFPPRKSCPEWEWLQLRAKEDPRIHLIEASLERDELLAILAACDVFLSLHRSEGFGRAIAEVLQLGVDVIATDYGGNTDFCSGPLSHLVRCKEIPIPSRAYPHAEGQFWGDPDLDHAVELMHKVAARRFDFLHNPDYAAYDVSSDPSVLSLYREYFSPSVVGKRYKKRLNELWSQ